MLEIIFTIIFTIIGSFFGDLAFALIIRPFRTDIDPLFKAIGYGMIGLIIGILSLIFFPTYLIKDQIWRLVSFLITPLIAGLITAMLKVDKLEKQPFILKNHRFYYDFLFAFGWVLARLVFTKQVA